MKREEPGPGQESVWDYPRPPRLEKCDKHVRVIFGGKIIADSRSSKRVLETSHPPVYYIPPGDVNMKYLEKESGSSYCEWKGQAHYYSISVGDHMSEKAAWCYASPNQRFEGIKDHIAFYPHKMDACYVDEEEVQAQEGSFYGGWITDDIAGPFKGGQGTIGW
ncbi:MAG: DUF427 domain-containing protein [Balneolaceae bacterium]|nr:DUF427 domain-containing protein [Balneolaceae bacterium]